MAAIVLVHGAYHGGWCWRDSARLLRGLGHAVFAPTLTGLGERSHLRSRAVDLDMHIQDVANVIEWEELDDVVLVGHSYGGMVVSGVADRLADRLAATVYLDAYRPADGESVLGARDKVPGGVKLEISPEDGVTPPPPEVFGLTGELADWLRRRTTPQPYETVVQPIRLTGAWTRPAKKLYIRCRQYPHPACDRYLAASEADPAWVALAGDWPHNVMMTDPEWFVDTLCRHAL